MIEEKPIGTDVVAERYSIALDTAQKWLSKGLIHGTNLSGRWYATWDAVFAFEGRLSMPQGQARERAKLPLLTVEKLAERYGQHPETIRNKLKLGVMPGRLIGRRWYGDWEGISAYEAEMRARDWRCLEPAQMGSKRA